MPITVLIPGVGGIGPGWLIDVHTDFPGPFDPSLDHWSITIEASEVNVLGAWAMSIPCTSQTQFLDLSELELVVGNETLFEGQAVRLRISLVESGVGDLDIPYSQTGWQWKPTTNIAQVVNRVSDQVAGKGLTQEQADQLAATNEASALSALTDALTLTELTNGPTSGPLVTQLNTVTFGVIVRLTSLPVGLEPQTPDGQYWTKTLAVVRVFRGNDLWIRAPIHTPTKIVSFENQGLTVWVTNLTLTQWLLNMRLLVDFLPGVTGQVFQMHFP